MPAEADPRLDLVEAVRRAAERADGHDPLDEAVTLRLKHHGLDGARLWVEGDPAEPTTTGFALRRGTELDVVVHPETRGIGVGARLVEQGLAEPGELSAWSHGNHPAAQRLAAAYGLERVRDLWVMRRPVGAEAEALPALVVPDGVALRGFDPTREQDAADVLRVNAAAFAHHPEQGGMDADDLAARMGEDWFDPAGLILAHDRSGGGGDGGGGDGGDGGSGDGSGGQDGELLGFHWTKRHSPDLGEVYVVGIAPAAQGRGLGKVLTLAGLHHLAGAGGGGVGAGGGGVGEILLYVESDNDPAVAVYAGLGFAHADVDTHVMYRRSA